MINTLRRLADRVRPVPRLDTADDADIVFVMPVFRDAPVARRALGRLRRAYPTARVALICDGDPEFPGAEIGAEFDVDYELGENLYAMRHGGAMIHRILAIYLRAPARVLVRLDSDARIDRRLAWLPSAPGLYGTIGKRSGTIQGGCIVLPDATARHLHETGVFLCRELTDPAASWGRYSTAENVARKTEQSRVSYDKALHWGCVEAGVPIRDYAEVHSVWKPAPGNAEALANRDERCAIVHPDKMEGE